MAPFAPQSVKKGSLDLGGRKHGGAPRRGSQTKAKTGPAALHEDRRFPLLSTTEFPGCCRLRRGTVFGYRRVVCGSFLGPLPLESCLVHDESGVEADPHRRDYPSGFDRSGRQRKSIVRVVASSSRWYWSRARFSASLTPLRRVCGRLSKIPPSYNGQESPELTREACPGPLNSVLRRLPCRPLVLRSENVVAFQPIVSSRRAVKQPARLSRPWQQE